MAKKGQNLRVFISDKCIAAATDCSIHIGTNLEDSSTKDSSGNWQQQECTGKNWDITASALVIDDSTGMTYSSVKALIGTKVAIKVADTNGEQNRTAVASGMELSGNAWVSDISLNASNKQNQTWSVTLTGDGALS